MIIIRRIIASLLVGAGLLLSGCAGMPAPATDGGTVSTAPVVSVERAVLADEQQAAAPHELTYTVDSDYSYGKPFQLALTPGQKAVVLFAQPPPRLDLNFTSLPSLPSYATFTRTSAAWDFNSQGILTQFASGVPRFPVYDPATLANLGIRIEQAHTNAILNNSTITPGSGGWLATASTGVTSSASAVAGLDGNTAHAWVIAPNASSGDLRLQSNITVTSDSTTWTAFVPVRKTVGAPSVFPALSLKFTSGGTPVTYTAVLNTTTGAVTATSGSPSGANVINLGNYWLLWIAGPNNNSSNTVLAYSFYPFWNSDGSATQQTTGVTGSQTISFPQVTNTSLPLSIIPTSGTAVTVNAETLSIPPSSIGIPANPSGLTFEADYAIPVIAGATNFTALDINDGTVNNRTFLFVRASDALQMGQVSATNNTTQFFGGVGTYSAGTLLRSVMAISPSGTVIANNGASTTAGAITMPSGLTTLNMGVERTSAFLNGTIKRARVWNVALPKARVVSISNGGN